MALCHSNNLPSFSLYSVWSRVYPRGALLVFSSPPNVPGAWLIFIQGFGLAFAGFLFSGSIGVTLNLCVNYCIDTYADLGGEAMITVIVIRNTMSFGIGYGLVSIELGVESWTWADSFSFSVTPWANNLGIQNTFISAAFISSEYSPLCQAPLLLQIYSYYLFRGTKWSETDKNIL